MDVKQSKNGLAQAMAVYRGEHEGRVRSWGLSRKGDTMGSNSLARSATCRTPVALCINWLQVLGATELAQIDQRVGQQLHTIVPLLDTFKAEQESFELIFPRKGALHAHPQRMDGFIEEAFASALRGLTVAGILLDIE